MAKFFTLPRSVLFDPKLLRKKAEGDTYIIRGYSPIGMEKITQDVKSEEEVLKLRQVEDVRDMFDFGPDKGPGATREPNVWPAEEAIPGFKDFSTEFFWTCHEAGMNVLRAVALGLDLEENFFTDAHQNADHILRYHHYPAVDRASLVTGTKNRVGAHSDYGTMTLLFQDEVGGLQVENPHQKGQFGESRRLLSWLPGLTRHLCRQQILRPM